MKNFSTNLKEIRKTAKMTQKQVGESIGIAEAQYRHYEMGLRLPGFEILIKMSDCFGVSLDFLMRGEEFFNR